MQTSDLISLPVEVSGWDSEGRFFVEHTTLDPSELGQETLLLRHAVQRRSLIFIRALNADSFTKSHPEAHHVESMESSERLGYSKLYLAHFPPRRKNGCTPKDSAKHPTSVRQEAKLK